MERTSEASEVAKALGLSADSIGRYAREGRIPFDLTPGGHRRYNVDEVRQALRPAAGGGVAIFAVPAATRRRQAIRSVRTLPVPAGAAPAEPQPAVPAGRSTAVARLLAGARSVQFSSGR
ncbi:MAG: MerR family DNA-binding transcriptional regulator [Acidimicrobiia bacterium]